MASPLDSRFKEKNGLSDKQIKVKVDLFHKQCVQPSDFQHSGAV